ncbi:HEPN domain-containing protein [Gimesia maris]|uniref:HEPN domain-containing protein n=1 Tax=Gimesia maris TaxID=122 RepID=UPI003A8F0985
MPYQSHFKHADDVIVHLDTIVPLLADPLLQAKYAGFTTVAAVTVYELAIKEIFIEFGAKKHNVFGTFTESFFSRINGRIKYKAIKEDYVQNYGDRYLKRFKKKIEIAKNKYFITNRRDIVNSYTNLILWRNEFAHEGTIKNTATYQEVVQAYNDGKEVIRCLAETMIR